MNARLIHIPNEVTMPTRLLSILILLGLTFSASAAWALTPGPYLELKGYGNWLEDSNSPTETGNFYTSYDGGIGGGLALGYDLLDAHPALGRGRVELEVAGRRSPVDQLEFREGSLPADGDLTVNSLIFNTFYDFHDDKTSLVPYLSIGGGYAEVSIDQVSTMGAPFIVSGSDGVLVGQIGVGLGITLNDHLTGDIGYRFFTTEKPHFTLADGSDFSSEILSHNLMLGLRFKF
jgi:opacity protein-like surface antigen